MIYTANFSEDAVSLIEYVFATTKASTTPPHDFGIVAVVDGESIKVTSFRTANIPPPMALHEIMAHSNIIDVAFNGDASSIAVLHQQGISIFEWKDFSPASSAPVLIGRFTFEKGKSPHALYQQISFSGLNQNEVLVLQRSQMSSVFRRFGFDEETGRMEEIVTEFGSHSKISTLSTFIEHGKIHPFIHGASGDMHSLAFGDQSLSRCSFPTYLPWVELILYRDDRIAFGMSRNGHLYANSRLLVKNCTSFLVTPAHLIFTTTHLLKFVHITEVHGIPTLVSTVQIVILTPSSP